MFKEKNTKKRIVVQEYSKEKSTLDARHQNMLQKMSFREITISELKDKRVALNNELNILYQENAKYKQEENTECKTYNEMWERIIELRDSLRNIDNELAADETNTDEIDYYEKTGNILFQYYELLEKQEVSELTSIIPPPVRQIKGRKKLPPLPTRTILDAFAMKPDDTSSQNNDIYTLSTLNIMNVMNVTNLSNVTNTMNVTNVMNVMNVTNLSNVTNPLNTSYTSYANNVNNSKNISSNQGNEYKDKSSLVDDYMAIIDSNHLKYTNSSSLGNCPKCDILLACVQQDGAMVCTECGYQELLLVEQNRPMIRQPSKDASHFSYKRINHFREWLSQVQGKESTDIPEEVFEKILQEIKKEKIQDTNKLTYIKMREILKKLKINRYYEHINYIINRINGVPTPNFSPELEDKLCNMFKEIQAPFLRHCPQSRKNFLSYSFCLHKLVQILGLHDYLKYFTLLRSREKLYIQDQIWKKICEDLDWPMYPSL